MLAELESSTCWIVLVPAPAPRFEGHMIRTAGATNAPWYRSLVFGPDGGRTGLRRGDAVRVLTDLISGAGSKSKWGPVFARVAERRIASRSPSAASQ